MRKKCTNQIYELAKKSSKVIYLGSDLTPNLIPKMIKKYPSRYFMEGISEANLVGVAAGLALEGFIPYVQTIATFITRRCFEQLAVDVCLHNLPVRLIGNGGGLVYTPLGPTHLAIEDISIMRSLPNMTVVAVSGEIEMSKLMNQTLSWKGPIYIRLGKGGDPIISKGKNFKIGRGVVYEISKNRNFDYVFFSTGIMTETCIRIANKLKSLGKSCVVIHLHTIKPLDEQLILKYTRIAKRIVIVEEHSVVGGLFSAVNEFTTKAYATKKILSLPPVDNYGIPDKFPEGYGKQLDMLKKLGLSYEGILKEIMSKN